MYSVNSVNRCSFGVGEWSGPQLISLRQWQLCANTVLHWHTGALRTDPFTLIFPLCHSFFPIHMAWKNLKRDPPHLSPPFALLSCANFSFQAPTPSHLQPLSLLLSAIIFLSLSFSLSLSLPSWGHQKTHYPQVWVRRPRNSQIYILFDWLPC